jgi:hypothetical protein
MPVVDVSTKAARPDSVGAPASCSAHDAGEAAAAAHLEALVTDENPVTELNYLKQKAAELRKEKQQLTRALRNAQRKHKRLKEKA